MSDRKPDITWIEGLIDYSFTDVDYGDDDVGHRSFGIVVGQFVVGTYAIELLLQYALDERGISYRQKGHNLSDLYSKLPRKLQLKVENKYKSLVHSRLEWAWDYQKTVKSYLEYIGPEPITHARYFWNPNKRPTNKPLIFGSRKLHDLIYALFIVLHNYPSKPIKERHQTNFVSVEDSVKKDQQTIQS